MCTTVLDEMNKFGIVIFLWGYRRLFICNGGRGWYWPVVATGRSGRTVSPRCGGGLFTWRGHDHFCSRNLS
jgi:hypothetical protein